MFEERMPVDGFATSEDLSEAATDLRLMRLRLFLALITMFAIPLAITAPVLHTLWAGRGSSLVGPMLLISALAMVLGLLTVVLARKVMEPAERLEEARSTLAKAYEVARSEALLDGLTGLGNHRSFQDELARQWEITRRHGVPMAVAIIDLDEFKLVNDAQGHAAGDRVLERFAAAITGVLRKSDRAFRIGGDEFAVILPHADGDAAAICLRRLLSATLEGPVGRVNEPPISFSAGISASASRPPDRETMVREADAALYWGKRHGRTCVTVFDLDRHGGTSGTQSLSDLSAAVARVAAIGAVRAVFQPIYDLGTGRPLGYEGLVRPLPGTGFSDAGALFAAAEATGRTVELDLACVTAVMAAFGPLGLPGSLTLNVSPRTLESMEFNVPTLVRMLGRHRLEPSRVVLELTERENVEDIERVRGAVDACRRAGIRIAADDVGAGNAGLRLLSQMRFDIVKIDLSLVQGGAVRSSSEEIVRTLKDLADRWGATVVAEGVETAEQLTFVRSLGIRAGQGYLLGRPSDQPTADGLDIERLAATSVAWLADRRRAVPA